MVRRLVYFQGRLKAVNKYRVISYFQTGELVVGTQRRVEHSRAISAGTTSSATAVQSGGVTFLTNTPTDFVAVTSFSGESCRQLILVEDGFPSTLSYSMRCLGSSAGVWSARLRVDAVEDDTLIFSDASTTDGLVKTIFDIQIGFNNGVAESSVPNPDNIITTADSIEYADTFLLAGNVDLSA